MKKFLYILFVVMASNVNSQTLIHSDGEVGGFIGLFNNPDTHDIGIEVGAVFPVTGGALKHHFKISALLYEAESEFDDDDLYGGFSIGYFVSFDLPLTPKVGVGIFGGSTSFCTEESNDFFDEPDFFGGEEEDCDDGGIVAIYPEFAFDIKIRSVTISPFVRRYFDSTETKASNSYGLNLALNF